MKQWFMEHLGTLEGFALHKLLPAVIILVVGILAIRVIIKILTVTLAKTKLEQAVSKLLRTLLRSVLYILLALMTASALGIDITGVVALASVLTLAVSLALQNALANVIGGFTLLYSKPFVAEDYVEIAGQSGTVKDVGLAYTRLATPDNKLISIPNSSVVAAEIVNYTTTGKRRLDIVIRTAYDVPVDAVTTALLEAAKLPDVLEDPAPFAGLRDYQESTVEYVLQVWTPTSQYWPVKYAINQNIQTVFAEKGLSLSYPHLNVHLDK